MLIPQRPAKRYGCAMITALLLALRQLSDPAILRLLAKVVGLTLLCFIAFGALTYWGLIAALDRFGWADGGALAAAATAALLAIAAAIFLFRLVAMAVLNIFSDEVVEAVERRHYPVRAADARPPDLWLGTRMGLASAGRALLWNGLALPVYAVLLATGIGTVILFLLVNGWLVGRDLQDMVVARHRQAEESMRRTSQRLGLSRGARQMLGMVVTALLLLPVVNLLAPVLGAAMATHMVHRRNHSA